MVPDDLAQAVLSREDVVRYLRSATGVPTDANGSSPTSKSSKRRSGTSFIARSSTRCTRFSGRSSGGSNISRSSNRPPGGTRHLRVEPPEPHGLPRRAGRAGRQRRAPAHYRRGHQPVGGPLGLIHKHVTGAIPIRRNTKDPAYLITLKAYVASCSAARTSCSIPKVAQLQRRAEKAQDRPAARGAALGNAGPDDRADRDFLRPRARGSHPRTTARQAEPAPVRARARRDDPIRRRVSVTRVRDVRPADSARRLGSRIAARCAGAREADPGLDWQARESTADLRGRHRHAAVGEQARLEARAKR